MKCELLEITRLLQAVSSRDISCAPGYSVFSFVVIVFVFPFFFLRRDTSDKSWRMDLLGRRQERAGLHISSEGNSSEGLEHLPVESGSSVRLAFQSHWVHVAVISFMSAFCTSMEEGAAQSGHLLLHNTFFSSHPESLTLLMGGPPGIYPFLETKAYKEGCRFVFPGQPWDPEPGGHLRIPSELFTDGFHQEWDVWEWIQADLSVDTAQKSSLSSQAGLTRLPHAWSMPHNARNVFLIRLFFLFLSHTSVFQNGS